MKNYTISLGHTWQISCIVKTLPALVTNLKANSSSFKVSVLILIAPLSVSSMGLLLMCLIHSDLPSSDTWFRVKLLQLICISVLSTDPQGIGIASGSQCLAVTKWLFNTKKTALVTWREKWKKIAGDLFNKSPNKTDIWQMEQSLLTAVTYKR